MYFIEETINAMEKNYKNNPTSHRSTHEYLTHRSKLGKHLHPQI